MRTISSRHTRFTLADDDSLLTYLRKIEHYRPLSREEEIAAFTTYQATGDQAAHELVVNHNLLFVVTVAKRFAPQSGPVTLSDLIQEGNIALLEAVERFDLTKGKRFITFAVWWLKKYMSEVIARHDSLVTRPVHHFAREQRHRHELRRKEGLEGHAPSAGSGYSPKLSVLSLDAPSCMQGSLVEREQLLNHDLIQGEGYQELEQSQHEEEVRLLVDQALQRLDVTPRLLLTYLYGLGGATPQTLDQVGAQLGLLPSTFKKMRNQAQREFKEHLQALLGGKNVELTADLLWS